MSSALQRPGEDGPLLDVRGLAISHGTVPITTPTDIVVQRGETIAIVGESGSGKSLTARAIAGLLPRGMNATGDVALDGIPLLKLAEHDFRAIRGHRIAMLMQDPFSMLNPLMRSGDHIGEMLRGRPEFASRASRTAEVERRLAEVGIVDADVAGRMPFQLSGGMCQRVALAAALARDPDLLIADEPSTALDATTQAEIVKLLGRVQRERQMSLILITHNLRLAFSTCQRIYVIYAGSVLETGSADAVERQPFHPYTLGLLLSEPPAEKRVPRLVAIPGSVPRTADVIDSCGFAGRCDWAQATCRAAKPQLITRDAARLSACIRHEEIKDSLVARREAARSLESTPLRWVDPGAALLRVDALVKTFTGERGHAIQALRGVSLHISPGESIGLVGESGSGKTTLARCLVGLETAGTGDISIDGIAASNFAALAKPDRATVRRAIQMVFQDPYSALNPRHSIGQALSEALAASAGATGPATPGKLSALLAEVGLPAALATRRPASLSGGERQRIAIARALAVNPSILVCDEAVSSLDVSVKVQVLNLLKRLQAEYRLAYLFITHDLAVARQMTDRLYVLHRGEIVEEGPTETVIASPQHPYTRRLVASIPRSAIRSTP